MEARPHQVVGKIFSIVTHRTRTGSVLKLEVNFPQEVVQLSKEVYYVCAICVCMSMCMCVYVHDVYVRMCMCTCVYVCVHDTCLHAM